MFAIPNTSADPLALPVDVPRGVGRPKRRRTTAVGFPPEAILVCDTHGLVERRNELIDIGLDRLRAAIRPGPAETVWATIMNILGIDQSVDDVALLAPRHAARPEAVVP